MRLIRSYVLLFLLSSFFFTCKPKSFLDNKVYTDASRQCSSIVNSTFIVYYFNGDCAFCIGKGIDIENNAGNKKVIFIANTRKPDILRYTFKEAKIKGCLVIDSSNVYSNVLKLDEIIYVNKDRSIASRKNE